MRKRFLHLLLSVTVMGLWSPPAYTVEHGHATINSDGKHHWLLPNHPRLRRITKAVGFGAVTGGIIGPVLGAGVVGGAAVGAAEHGTIRGVKDRHDLKKTGRLDHHIW